MKQAVELIKKVKSQGYKIALDDFGTGYSGMQQLYNTEADFIKIDRFFVSEDESAFRKRLFIANIVHLAHLLGIYVIAEGVENEREYYLCKELGCDYVQGYFVKQPSSNFLSIEAMYPHIQEMNDKDRRKLKDDRLKLQEHIERLPTLKTDSEIDEVFNLFRDNPQCSFIPILNTLQEPIGIIRERDLKQYVYSPYGREVLKKIAKTKGVMEFVSACPKSELRFAAEKIMNTFSVSQGDEGIMMTEGGKYAGFLYASDLLKILNEKNLEQARDQNPLTKLNGNQMITDFITSSLGLSNTTRYFVYFDFDNFKPFNDKYGFRRGDRAILLFSDILKKATSKGSFYSENSENEQMSFLGHVGGDDFFLGAYGKSIDEIFHLVKLICDQYSKEVADLYDHPDREAGVIRSVDREGNPKEFSLLTVSAGILELSEGMKYDNQEEIGKILAEMKKSAKGLTGGIILASVLP
jgi:GGDEF domain-containing protein